MVPAMHIGRRDEDLKRRVARPCAHTGEARVDADRAILHRDDAVRDAEAEVVVRMDAALRFGPEHPVIGGEPRGILRSEEHTSELQSLMRNSYAVFCLKKKKKVT